MTALVTKQVISLFIIMIIGYLASGIGFFDKRTADGVSKLVVYVTNPLVIFMAFMQNGGGRMGEMVTIVGCSAAIHIVATVLASFLFKGRPAKEAKALRFSLIFSNCGYMGYPLLSAMFPKNGMFYGACYVLFFTVYMWTAGVFMLSSGKQGNIRKAFINPGILAAVLGLVFSWLGIGLPAALSTALSSTANLTFPLAMLVLGCMLKNAPLGQLIGNTAAYVTAFVKLILIPLGVLTVCGIFKVAAGTTYICVIMASTPVAAKAPLLAGNYGADRNASLAAVAISTVACVFTIPLMLWITKAVVGV
ncbi:MAG: AEC family transporter [Ruminococcaceae bacterium]|nr:AEC family transporter [Oscillospiraceae bacterium]